MKYALIFCLFLSGCATIPDSLSSQVQEEAFERVAAFNHLRGTNLPIPSINYRAIDADGETFMDKITINPELCENDMDDCLNDTVPHELAHYAVFYFQGYQTRIFLHKNGMNNSVDTIQTNAEHDSIWCDTMRAFGGFPEKHGYCH